jgi:hypothetical protein
VTDPSVGTWLLQLAAQPGTGTARVLFDLVGSVGSGCISGLGQSVAPTRAGHASEGILTSGAVVEVLDEDDDRPAELDAGVPPPAVEDVLLRRAGERLHGRAAGTLFKPEPRPARRSLIRAGSA